jgi:hypothetical protein
MEMTPTPNAEQLEQNAKQWAKGLSSEIQSVVWPVVEAAFSAFANAHAKELAELRAELTETRIKLSKSADAQARLSLELADSQSKLESEKRILESVSNIAKTRLERVRELERKLAQIEEIRGHS